jgi:hypothetical protein
MTRLMGWICTLSLIAMSAAAARVDYQGLWRATTGSESGWRLKVTHQGRTISASWTRDANDGTLWNYSAMATRTEPNMFTGTLSRWRW